MEQDCKQNISQIEQIRERMKQKGWKQADLARATGVSTGVLSRFFGNDGISDRNLFRVMTALGFFKGETISEIPNSIKEVQKLGEDWSIKLLLEQMMRRLDEQQETNRNIVKTISRMKDEIEACRVMIQQGTLSIVDLNKRIGNIRSAMDEAAKIGSFEPLGGGCRKRQLIVANRLRLIKGDKDIHTHTQQKRYQLQNK